MREVVVVVINGIAPETQVFHGCGERQAAGVDDVLDHWRIGKTRDEGST
jgi:hypothetical protein